MKGAWNELNKLREIRESKGMNITDLANASGITRQTIYRLENEENENINTKTLKALANALDAKVTDFFAE